MRIKGKSRQGGQTDKRTKDLLFLFFYALFSIFLWRSNSDIDTEEPIKMVVDINKYKMLIIVKANFKLILDKNFMNFLGFSKYVINPGYNRSDLIPKVDKTRYLKIYCNIVNNKNENEFLSNVFIKNSIGDLVIYDNYSIYKKQKIIESDFNFIEICI